MSNGKDDVDRAAIGVLIFEGDALRIAGDPGCPATFDFPIIYGKVQGGFTDLVEGSPVIKQEMMRTAQDLVQQGVSAIVGDCGLMALYQQTIANAVQVPVLLSSLSLIPLIELMLNPAKKIGVVTGHSQLLSERHLREAGAYNIDRLVIQGMENEPHFREIVIEGGLNLDVVLMERDVLNAVTKLMAQDQDIAAIVLECSNLGTFSSTVSQTFGLPVFDVNMGIKMLDQAISPQSYH